jgi:Xaa-Pro aminopeptidase
MSALTYEAQKIELLNAQRKAETLFEEIETRGLIRAGMSEKELNAQVYKLAEELFGIKKYWHKRIVRSGINTLAPYDDDPPDLKLLDDDLVFIDYGPVFEEWEADFGRTFILGNDPIKARLLDDLGVIFQLAKSCFESHQEITGAELYEDVCSLASNKGWRYGGPHAGHLVGVFPHEKLIGDEFENYICAENKTKMRSLSNSGHLRHWILEIHLINDKEQYGGFYEQLLTE